MGKWGHIPWPDNLIDVPADQVRRLNLDCIIYQRPDQFLKERYKILSKEQLQRPQIYLEHDPPMETPFDTLHCVDDPRLLLMHVTPFNNLMWNSRRTPTRVIEHGVIVPEQVAYTGELERGLVVINHLARRGRRLGRDIYEQVESKVPLHHVGMEAELVKGGLREIRHSQLSEFESRYRFLFNPIRYSSLALSVCEAMMVGLPVVALATTEMATVITNGISGYISNDVKELIGHMKELLGNLAQAKRLGEGARKTALERFNIHRFIRDWEETLAFVTGTPKTQVAVAWPEPVQ